MGSCATALRYCVSRLPRNSALACERRRVQWSENNAASIRNSTALCDLDVWSSVRIAVSVTRTGEYMFNTLKFLPSVSTHTKRPATPLVQLVISLILSAIKLVEDHRYVRCIMLDFTKAFDTVDHLMLLQKLEQYHSPNNILSWILSFLSEICQTTKISGILVLQ